MKKIRDWRSTKWLIETPIVKWKCSTQNQKGKRKIGENNKDEGVNWKVESKSNWGWREIWLIVKMIKMNMVNVTDSIVILKDAHNRIKISHFTDELTYRKCERTFG